MWLTVFLTFVATAVAALPLWVSRWGSWKNPATYVFVIVGSSLFGKGLYIALFRPSPRSIHDTVYAKASSSDVFFLGAVLGLVAVLAYVAGFFVLGARRWRSIGPAEPRPLAWSRVVIWISALGVTATFIAYLQVSGQGVAGLFDSAKRFKPSDIGVGSRFAFLPYYFFKLSTLAGSASLAAALLVFRSVSRRDDWNYGLAFSYLYCFALYLSHYASLRLFILIVMAQVLLLATYSRRRRAYPLVGLLVLLTVSSFTVITFAHRTPEFVEVSPEDLAVIDGKTEELVAEAVTDLVAEPEDETGPAPETAPPADTRAEMQVVKTSPDEAAAAADGEEDVLAPITTEPKTMASVSTDSADAVPVEESDETPPQAVPEPPPEPLEPPRPLITSQRLRWLGDAAFGGRYLLDLSKLSHMAHHFSGQHGLLWGRSIVALPLSNDDGPLSVGRYLAIHVFHEPNNNIPPGFLGELFINFGWLGLVAGFFALGALHRWTYNHLATRDLHWVAAGCLLATIPTTTFILLNSSLLSATARLVLDVGVIAGLCVSPGLVWTRVRDFARRRRAAAAG